MMTASQTEMAFLALSRKPTTIEHTAMEELVKEQGLINSAGSDEHQRFFTSMKNIPCPSTATTINRRRVLSGVSGGLAGIVHSLYPNQWRRNR